MKVARASSLIHRVPPSRAKSIAARIPGGSDSGGAGIRSKRMSAYKATIRRLLFRFDPEFVHDWTARVIRFVPVFQRRSKPVLACSVAGISFPSPIGLAAGFDKDARFFKWMYRFGFGCVEVGTLTPRPQAGNERPRIQQLRADNAIINQMGFPNCGLTAALPRMVNFEPRLGSFGVNIGANADSLDKIADYIMAYRAVAPHADYVTINVSSPNTPGLRILESGAGLSELLNALDIESATLKTPFFLKVSPDLSESQVDDTCDTLLKSRVAGVIVGNTTVTRPDGLKSNNFKDRGGLSGEPLKPLSELALERFYSRLGARLPIISVGGVASAEDAYRRIRKGASLVQLYTAFIYEGPYMVSRMNRELEKLLLADGHKSIVTAVGSEVTGPDRKIFVSKKVAEKRQVQSGPVGQLITSASFVQH